MSYDSIISQYKGMIGGVRVEYCDSDLVKYLKGSLEAEEKECDKTFISVYKGDRKYYTYYGEPEANELWPFLNSLVRISKDIVHLTDTERDLASQISGDVKLFVTKDCTKCPAVAELLYQVAILNPKVRLSIIDSEEYEDEARKYRVMSVPKIILNEKTEVPGSFTPGIVLKMLAKGSAQEFR